MRISDWSSDVCSSDLYVAEHDQEQALFHFFKLTDRHGRALVPGSRVLRFARGLARAAEVERLGLAAGDEVIRIARVRSLAGRPALFERIVLPAALFPGLAERGRPNPPYPLSAPDYRIPPRPSEVAPLPVTPRPAPAHHRRSLRR